MLVFDCQRGEIIEWVNQGGGLTIDAHLKQKAHFTIECHGVIPRSVDSTHTTYVSSHWIRSCLEVYMCFPCNSTCFVLSFAWSYLKKFLE